MSKNMAVLDENNNVINVVVCNDDEPETATQVTYTDTNPAYIGGDYVDGYFYTPQPYPSWTRDNGIWQPPTPMPTDDQRYIWDEATLTWKLYETPSK
jgi:hypothetical protein